MHAELFLEQDCSDKVLPLGAAFPLRKAALAGLQLSAPRDPEAALEQPYGDRLAPPGDLSARFRRAGPGPEAAAAISRHPPTA